MNITEKHKAGIPELTATKVRNRWELVIIASRESLVMLLATLNAAQISARGAAGIDCVINGNKPLALALANHLDKSEVVHGEVPVKVWDIAVGDKANAWNQYIHHIWAGESIAFFIDGYVRLNPDSIQLLGEAIADRVEVIGGTGVSNGGPSGKSPNTRPTPENGFHGNFCCIKGTTIEQMRRRKIFLPFGLYRVDSLMGALLNLALDPARNVWIDSRIFVHPRATWQTDPKHWWKINDIRAQVRRILRQSRGVLENLAVRDHLTVRRQPPESMPPSAKELVLDWMQRCPTQAQKVLRYNPLARRALAEIKRSATKPETTDQSAPVLLRSGKML